MNLPDSVRARVAREFVEGDRAEVEGTLSTYGEAPHERERERVLLDLLALAAGDKGQVIELVARAKRDYRDILFRAEHPSESRLDTPEKRAAFAAMVKRFGAKVPLDEKE